MANIYHGSWLRHFFETALAFAKSPRRQFRQWRGYAAARGSPEAARHLDRIRTFTREGRREDAIAYATNIAETARQANDRKMLWWVSELLGGLDQYDLQASTAYVSRRIEQTPPPNDWNGEPVKGRLVADFRHRTPAFPLRHARFIKSAADRSGECIAICEPRLVPLFQRSFPDVDVRRGDGDVETLRREADALISHQDLPYLFGRSAAAIEAAFVPLRADLEQAAQFRQRYRKNGKPLIGFSWGSKNQAKDAPALADWSVVFNAVPATYVSLQYGDVDVALRKLRRLAGDDLIHDDSVDQMTDLDTFAAQLTSLDAIISTSSTVVHLAGALGIPTVVILDESLLTWPIFADRIPWYPRTVLVHQRRRDWPAVMKEAQTALKTILPTTP